MCVYIYIYIYIYIYNTWRMRGSTVAAPACASQDVCCKGKFVCTRSEQVVTNNVHVPYMYPNMANTPLPATSSSPVQSSLV